ncbi:uncharacterized protein LOC111893506 isoform X1 [Lactuca sativa]|uniref:DHHA2 domain-containing protein n=1 Tax=Lactuca sativa TaxID=4236 RepID=A0A9R1WS86_LACSA|nr:uncharacterized protein LOC111893506 isoform X1 [Lactuca sativa]KAJ0227847.1 hypothetical protein LSAT_V11C100036580 [Lactuca sativa]
MASQSDSMLQNHQEKYIRGRENPVFDGLRGNTSMNHRTSIFDFLGSNGKQKMSRSNSVIGHAGCKGGIQEHASSYSSSKGSQFDIREEPFGLSFSRSLDLGSSQISGFESKSSVDMSVAKDFEANSVHGDREEALIEKSFSVSKMKQVVHGVSLPPSAASFYYRGLPSMDVVESCEGIQRLNLYLKACKDAVNAGVPGQFLRAVLGHVSDAGSFISTIMYSFYLNEKDKNSQFCTVPIINIKRADLKAHAELEWLLTSCNIDQPSIIFINEIDLSYYNLFGSLKVVLLNADKLPEKQEALKESLVEIFKGRKGGFADLSDDTIEEQECSCCALIAEKFASKSPEILVGKGFSRLLLSGILLDTENLTSPRCTSVDKYMSTLLLNGAGRFGCNGLYKILSDKMHNVSYLSVGQILQKDFRKWTKPVGKAESVGMSAVGMSISQLLSHDETSIQEIILFQQMNKLSLLIIVSGYHNLHKSFKEMFISAESKELMEDLLHFLNNHPSRLLLHVLYQSGLCDEMRAFSMDSITSLTIMEQLLEDFCREGKFFNYQPIKSFAVTR